MASLFKRLGGLEAITAVVDSFVARCAGDDRINRKFVRTDIPRLKKMFVDQVCEFNVPEAERNELLGVLGPIRDEIVEVRSDDTGTALPESYQAAPALG